MKRSMNLMIISFVYLMLLRLVLSIILPMSILSMGLLFDALALIAIFMLVAKLNKAWMQKTFYTLFGFIWTLVAIADVMYYEYFSMITTRASTQGLSFMSAELTVEYDLSILPALGILAIVVGLLFFILVKQKTPDNLFRTDYLFLMFILFMHLAMLFHFNRETHDYSLDYYLSDTYAYNEPHDQMAFVSDFGYYYFHLLDAFRLPKQLDSEAVMQELDDYFDQRLAHQPNDYTGHFEGSNVIQITVESLDTRFIDPIITPTLYRLMQEGYTFENYYVPVFSQGATCNSEFMATTGLYARRSNPWSNNVCYTHKHNDYPYSMPAQLQHAGYSTYYFHSGYEWFYQRETMMPSLGFETNKFIEDLDKDTYNPLLDTEMMQFFEHYLDPTESFYVKLLTYGLHGGYQPLYTDHYNDRIDSVYDADLDQEIRVYLQKMAEFDQFMTDLITYLQIHDVYDDTLLILYTDHYPFMLDDQVYETFTGIDTASKTLYQQTLIMYHASIETPQTFDQLGSTIDLAPTILNLVYPNAEFRYFFGQDLFSNKPNYVLFADLSLTDGAYYYGLNNASHVPSTLESDLRNQLEQYINDYERSKRLLWIDYFARLDEE